MRKTFVLVMFYSFCFYNGLFCCSGFVFFWGGCFQFQNVSALLHDLFGLILYTLLCKALTEQALEDHRKQESQQPQNVAKHMPCRSVPRSNVRGGFLKMKETYNDRAAYFNEEPAV